MQQFCHVIYLDHHHHLHHAYTHCWLYDLSQFRIWLMWQVKTLIRLHLCAEPLLPHYLKKSYYGAHLYQSWCWCQLQGDNSNRALNKSEYSMINRDTFCQFSIKTYVVTTYLNPLRRFRWGSQYMVLLRNRINYHQILPLILSRALNNLQASAPGWVSEWTRV